MIKRKLYSILEHQWISPPEGKSNLVSSFMFHIMPDFVTHQLIAQIKGLVHSKNISVLFSISYPDFWQICLKTLHVSNFWSFLCTSLSWSAGSWGRNWFRRPVDNAVSIINCFLFKHVAPFLLWKLNWFFSLIRIMGARTIETGIIKTLGYFRHFI